MGVWQDKAISSVCFCLSICLSVQSRGTHAMDRGVQCSSHQDAGRGWLPATSLGRVLLGDCWASALGEAAGPGFWGVSVSAWELPVGELYPMGSRLLLIHLKCAKGGRKSVKGREKSGERRIRKGGRRESGWARQNHNPGRGLCWTLVARSVTQEAPSQTWDGDVFCNCFA